MLDQLANIAEIIAGIAIVFAAIRAWPLLSDMRTLVRRRDRDGENVRQDFARMADMMLAEGITTVQTPRTAAEAVELLLKSRTQIDGVMGIEAISDHQALPVRIRVEATGKYVSRELCRISADGLASLADALKDRFDITREQVSGSAFLEYQDYYHILAFARGLHGYAFSLNSFPTSHSDWQVEGIGIDQYPFWSHLKSVLDDGRGLVLVVGVDGSGKATTISALHNYSSRPTGRTSISVSKDTVGYFRNTIQLTTQSADSPLAELIEHALLFMPNVLNLGFLTPANIPAMWSAYGQNHLTLGMVNARESVLGLQELVRQASMSSLTVAQPLIIMGQSLVGRLCPECAIKRPLTKQEQSQILQLAQDNHFKRAGLQPPIETHDAMGCDACQEGYVGLIGVMEYMNVDQRVLDAALAGDNLQNLRNIACEGGMITSQALVHLMAELGLTSIQEARRLTAILSYPIVI